MSIKGILFFVGCVFTWFVVLPLLAVIGMFALTSYAILSQINDLVFGTHLKTPDTRDARRIAARMCGVG
jgi:hypothetical protein